MRQIVCQLQWSLLCHYQHIHVRSLKCMAANWTGLMVGYFRQVGSESLTMREQTDGNCWIWEAPWIHITSLTRRMWEETYSLASTATKFEWGFIDLGYKIKVGWYRNSRRYISQTLPVTGRSQWSLIGNYTLDLYKSWWSQMTLDGQNAYVTKKWLIR